jgi:hypothetical protein
MMEAGAATWCAPYYFSALPLFIGGPIAIEMHRRPSMYRSSLLLVTVLSLNAQNAQRDIPGMAKGILD